MNSTCTVFQIIDQFLSEQSICENSRRTYRAGLVYFFSYLTGSEVWNPTKQKEVRLITAAMVVNFMNDLNKRNISVCSTGLYIAVIKRFFLWTNLKGIHENIASGIRGPKKYKGLSKDPLTLSQAKLFFSAIDRSNDIGKRNYAIISLLLLNGLRCIEVSRCNVKDIVSTGDIKAIWIQGKGRINKDCRVPITDEVYFSIMEYQKTKPEYSQDEPLFLTYGNRNGNNRISTRIITKIVFTLLTKTGIKTSRITTHSLRHTAANLAIQNGMQLPELKVFMRHSSYSITELYIQEIKQKNISDTQITKLLSNLIRNEEKKIELPVSHS